jgi:hypothetical protein
VHIPEAHELPHPPQLFGSLSVSTHAASQQDGLVAPIVVQSVSHAPQFEMSLEASEQLLAQHCGMSPPHDSPQTEQFSGSLVTSVHVPSHEVCPGSQAICPMHWPPMHAAPPQSLPHEPQLLESLSVSVQPPKQHDGDVPSVHAVPHAPQLLMSLARSVQPSVPQQPGVSNPSYVQSLPHAPQLRTSLVVSEHDDEQHDCIPMHAFPHVPQFFASDEVSSHVPLQQSGTRRLSIDVQSLPAAELHPPQFRTSVFVSVHTPSHWVGVLIAHIIPQTPAAQTCPIGHAVPHFPQFRLSV